MIRCDRNSKTLAFSDRRLATETNRVSADPSLDSRNIGIEKSQNDENGLEFAMIREYSFREGNRITRE
jgi:hypothetical protein